MIVRIDIDDTICFYQDNNKLDYSKAIPDYDRIKIINELYDQGHYIIYWSSRGMITKIDWYDVTKQQLCDWGVKYHELKLDKPVFDLLIDDKAFNSVYDYIDNRKKLKF